MPHDDDLDDFSHLPSVDEIASAEEKKALWKQHSRRQVSEPVQEALPEHSARDEALEEQLMAHELPVEQEFAAEDHPSHAPEWAEEGTAIHEIGRRAPITEPPHEPGAAVESPEWAREVFERAAEEPAPKKRRDPELLLPRGTESGQDEAPYIEVTHEELRLLQEMRRVKEVEAAPAAAEPDETKPVGSPDEKAKPAALPATKVRGTVENEFESKPEGPGPDAKSNQAGAAEAAGKTASDPTTAEIPHGFTPEEPSEPDARDRFRKVWEKIGGRALAASLAVHFFLLVTAAMIIITTVTEKEVDFLPGGGSKGAAEAAQSKQFKVQQKRNTWLKNKPLQRVVSTSVSPSLTLPEAPLDLDFPDATRLIGSKGMSGGGGFGNAGMGKGFGSGMGFGGKINFMGNTGVGRNIVFVVDVSASMSSQGDSGTGNRISRFDLLKRELTRTIGRLPPNTQFQVLFFSDFAWPHNEVDSRNLRAFEKYAWTISPDKTNVRVPQFRYVTANSTTVARSIQIINDADNPGGTNWGSGLFMALKAYPKPDVVFFMTDGNKSDAEGWVDAVSKINLSGGKRSVIHTTAMMEPDAAEELDQLAKRNGGNFTIVTAKGFTLTSEEFFKGQR